MRPLRATQAVPAYPISGPLSLSLYISLSVSFFLTFLSPVGDVQPDSLLPRIDSGAEAHITVREAAVHKSCRLLHVLVRAPTSCPSDCICAAVHLCGCVPVHLGISCCFMSLHPKRLSLLYQAINDHLHSRSLRYHHRDADVHGGGGCCGFERKPHTPAVTLLVFEFFTPLAPSWWPAFNAIVLSMVCLAWLGTQNFLICIEMAVAAIAHHRYYGFMVCTAMCPECARLIASNRTLCLDVLLVTRPAI